MEKKEVARWMDTIMSIPGMNEMVKLDLKVSRKNILLMTGFIENGLEGKGSDQSPLLQSLSDEDRKVLSAIGSDCLEKAGLRELSEKLKSF